MTEIITNADGSLYADVLNHGHVVLEQWSGGDLDIVNGARCSFNQQSDEMDERNEGLINYLMREKHMTPFELVWLKFDVKAPIFVFREWHRHRTACLTGDTVVTFVDSSGSSSTQLCKTMRELYDLWHVGQKNGVAPSDELITDVNQRLSAGESMRSIQRQTGVSRSTIARIRDGVQSPMRCARKRVSKMKVRVLNEDTMQFTTSTIKDVMYNGIEPVIRVVTEDGKDIEATRNHNVFTDAGWMTLGEAVEKDARLVANGLTHEELYDIPKEKVDLLRKLRSGSGSNFWKGGVSSEREKIGGWTTRMGKRVALSQENRCFDCRAECSNMHTHHIIPVSSDPTLAYEVDNLIAVCEPCHQSRHSAMYGKFVRIASVIDVGLQEVFDLEIEGPWHNFVANGLVVHNSINEWSARYSKLDPEFYVPERNWVTKQVGKPGAYKFDRIEDDAVAQGVQTVIRQQQEASYAAYEAMLESGVAKQLARTVLSVGIYSRMKWASNLRNVMHFLSLRNDPNAQQEIRAYASVMEQMVRQVAPATMAAFEKHGRSA